MYLYNRASHCGHITTSGVHYFLIIQRPLNYSSSVIPFIHTYIYIYRTNYKMYIYIYTHTHTHTHTQIYIHFVICSSSAFHFEFYLIGILLIFSRDMFLLTNFSSHTHSIPVGASRWNSIIRLLLQQRCFLLHQHVALKSLFM